MDNKKTFSLSVVNVVLIVCASMSAVQVFAGWGRVGTRAVQRFTLSDYLQSNLRVTFLSAPDVRAYAEERLDLFVSLEKQRELLNQICHLWLSNKYSKSDIVLNNDKQFRDFMLEWSKNHPTVADWTSHDVQQQLNSLVWPGQNEKALALVMYCRTEIAIQCRKCRDFGQAFLGISMPSELSVLACQAIDESGRQLLQGAAPLPDADDRAREEYRKHCQIGLESTKELEIQFGQKMAQSKDAQ